MVQFSSRKKLLEGENVLFKPTMPANVHAWAFIGGFYGNSRMLKDHEFPPLMILAIDDPTISQKLALFGGIDINIFITCQVATIESIIKFESK